MIFLFLKWLHLAALLAGATASLGLLIVTAAVQGIDTPEGRAALGRVRAPLMAIAPAAYLALILTGLLMFPKGTPAAIHWIITKFSLVAALGVGVFASRHLAQKAIAGDTSAAGWLRMVGRANLVLLMAIVFAAVMAFG